MDEGPLAAHELAARARIAPSTASEHLARLVDGGFLATSTSGRRRYYYLADATVAAAVEALAVVAPQPRVRSLRDATESELLRYARTCYDHLAGRVGVAIALALERNRAIVRLDGTYVLGPEASAAFARLEIDLDELRQRRRPLVRGCLDWSERELHLAGGLGAALTERLLASGWIRRRSGNRSIEVTTDGRAGLTAELGVDLGAG